MVETSFCSADDPSSQSEREGRVHEREDKDEGGKRREPSPMTSVIEVLEPSVMC